MMWVALTSLGLPFPSATAGGLPDYPVEQWCDQVARAAGTRSELLYGGCIGQEQTAYDHLKGTWGDASAQTQNWCDQVARAGGRSSYLLLNGCVDQEHACTPTKLDSAVSEMTLIAGIPRQVDGEVAEVWHSQTKAAQATPRLRAFCLE
ncbi:hypothetical protein [Bradyrhizobium sp. BR 1432]|uniref:hypothetical protein n=1 Tax=Bradyrhizobium sp. BR 1432 TaxID=3447966 RepID=UPI003EE676DA